MTPKKKKFYITTSIPYTNAPPHLGFSLEIVQADVLARYHRQKGADVFFLTGTDEHGLKTLKAAQEEGKEVMEFADEMSEDFKNLTRVLNISNTDFIRTTDKKRHLPSVNKLWEKYKKSGDIYRKEYQGFYCSGCEAFKTLKEVSRGKCIIHKLDVEVISEENYFFRLSKYLPRIKKIIEKDKIKIIPSTRKREVLNMISQGLEDVSFSRLKDKYWSWPVPGDPSQNFYVWQDALPNYLSALGYDKEGVNFKKYWPADVHCIGKDIIKFHAIYWPAMLLSAGLDLPRVIFVHGFITINGQKMSKSIGNVISPFHLVKNYGSDALRYYLLREIPPTNDADFTYEKFEKRYNSDLAKGLGNLVARVVSLAKIAQKKFKINPKVSSQISKTKKKWTKALDEFKFNEALISIWELISFCDFYLEKEQPWKESKKQKEVVFNLLFVLSQIADLLKPFLPETSEKIFKQLKMKKSEFLFPRI